MADIDIVPKHRSYLWLWIVIAVVIIAALWFALAGGSRQSRVGSLEPGASPSALSSVGQAAIAV